MKLKDEFKVRATGSGSVYTLKRYNDTEFAVFWEDEPLRKIVKGSTIYRQVLVQDIIERGDWEIVEDVFEEDSIPTFDFTELDGKTIRIRIVKDDKFVLTLGIDEKAKMTYVLKMEWE